MSSLLEEAIVDAAALKEAALKNAEAAVLEKYSTEVRGALSQLLEQDELDLGGDLGGDLDGDLGGDMGGGAPDKPTADTSFLDSVPYGFQNEELDAPAQDEIIEIDFDALKTKIEEEEAAGEGATGDEMIDTEEFATELGGELAEGNGGKAPGDVYLADPTAETGEAQEEETATDSDIDASAISDDERTMKKMGITTENNDVEIDEDLLNSIVEELVVDMVPRPQGWASINSADNSVEQANNDAMAAAADAHPEGLDEEEETTSTAPDVVSDNALFEQKILGLSNTNKELRGILRVAKTQLEKLNLENAKLVYQNKAMGSTSLNERQVNKIVEAVRRADSVEGARMIFETIQDAVGTTVDRRHRPQSLREAVTRPTSLLLHSNRTSEANYDPTAERLLRLAGLKK